MIRMVVANVIMVMVITIVIIIFKIMVGSPWCRSRGRSRRRSTGRRWQTFLKRFRIKTRRRSINSFIQRLTSVLSQASYSQELWRLWESSEGVEHTWIFLVRTLLMAGSYHIRVIFMYAVNQRWWEYLQVTKSVMIINQQKTAQRPSSRARGFFKGFSYFNVSSSSFFAWNQVDAVSITT